VRYGLAAMVMHSRDDTPHAVVVADLADGARAIAVSDDPALTALTGRGGAGGVPEWRAGGSSTSSYLEPGSGCCVLARRRLTTASSSHRSAAGSGP